MFSKTEKSVTSWGYKLNIRTSEPAIISVLQLDMVYQIRKYTEASLTEMQTALMPNYVEMRGNSTAIWQLSLLGSHGITQGPLEKFAQFGQDILEQYLGKRVEVYKF
jgi:hypothetical protein